MTRPHWDKMSDDSFNKVLKLIIILLYSYAVYAVFAELIA